MKGKDMRKLIDTGTCPQCGGALSSTNRLERTFVIGSCDPCNITWTSIEYTEFQLVSGSTGRVEAAPRWAT